jgi:hypothetical protein
VKMTRREQRVYDTAFAAGLIAAAQEQHNAPLTPQLGWYVDTLDRNMPGLTGLAKQAAQLAVKAYRSSHRQQRGRAG